MAVITHQPLLLMIILFLSSGFLVFDVPYGDECPSITEPMEMPWAPVKIPHNLYVVVIAEWAVTESNKGKRWLPFKLRLGKVVKAQIAHFPDGSGSFTGTHYAVLITATSDGHAYNYYVGWVLDRPHDPEQKRCLLGFGTPD